MESNNTLNEMFLKQMFDVGESRVKFYDIPFVSYPARPMAITIQTLSKDFNDKELFELAKSLGSDIVNEISSQVEKLRKFLPDRLKSLFELFQICGFGKIGSIQIEEKSNRVKIFVTNNPVIDYSKQLYGENSKAGNFYCGLYSGILEKTNNLKILNLNKFKFTEKEYEFSNF